MGAVKKKKKNGYKPKKKNEIKLTSYISKYKNGIR